MNRNFVACMLLGVVSSASAVTTGVMPRNSPSGNQAARVPISAEASKAMADDSSGMRKGTIQDLDIGRGSFHVYGEKHTFDVAKVRVFGRDGKLTSIHALHRGAAVRFLLDSEDKTRRRVSVLYLD